ncbi:DUF2947 family protein [Endozoicomonas sp. SCSIO W0465]
MSTAINCTAENHLHTWLELWESDDPTLPALITNTLAWAPETTFYYCVDN